MVTEMSTTSDVTAELLKFVDLRILRLRIAIAVVGNRRIPRRGRSVASSCTCRQALASRAVAAAAVSRILGKIVWVQLAVLEAMIGVNAVAIECEELIDDAEEKSKNPQTSNIPLTTRAASSTLTVVRRMNRFRKRWIAPIE